MSFGYCVRGMSVSPAFRLTATQRGARGVKVALENNVTHRENETQSSQIHSSCTPIQQLVTSDT